MAIRRAAQVVAQVALVLVGVLWALGGTLIHDWLSPRMMEDGTYWHLIDPISVERAGVLQREAILAGLVGLGIAAVHLVAAVLWKRRVWRYRVGMTLGVLYCVGAVPLAMRATDQPSGALPMLAVAAVVFGMILLAGSRRISGDT